MSQKRNQVRLNVEQLEDRTLMAGKVFAWLQSGDLNIVGDAGQNSITVQAGMHGEIMIFGNNGTTVNGKSGVMTGRSFYGDVDINLGKGSDTLA